MTTLTAPAITETRDSFPNAERPRYWPQEEAHYRSALEPGDIVCDDTGTRWRITAYDNAFSHLTAGRIAYLEATPDRHAAASGRAQASRTAWENTLTAANDDSADQFQAVALAFELAAILEDKAARLEGLDPSTLWEEILCLTEVIRAGDDSAPEAGRDLAEKVYTLNEWIMTDGKHPRQWTW
ncbi:hypothetical protein [Longispora fulva]|uniref:Uncharacterized protein n=1 Tax=Longispora fulva TaxID=619741 RepID=A0A8J7GVR5_9ACTN|nr:hypothetical protein [Longispora fulva]MBG6140480.1 hypothetical protein [Longispora fulva]